MKYNILFILFFIFHTAFAQTEFQKLYAADYKTEFKDIWPLPDGGQIVFGNSATLDYLMAKTDSTGSVIWSRRIGGLFSREYATRIGETNDGNYYLLGTIFTSAYNGIHLLKIDNSGGIVWNKSYYTNPSDSIGEASIRLTPDNGFIIGATYLENQHLNNAMRIRKFILLIRLDSGGNIMWTRRFTNYPSSSLKSLDIENDGAGGFTSLGIQRNGIIIFNCNQNGNMVWSNSYLSQDNNFQLGGQSIMRTSDGDYVMAGNTGYSYYLTVMKINGSGSSAWSERLVNNVLFGYKSSLSIQSANNLGYILSTEFYKYPMMIKIDSAGLFEWCKTYFLNYDNCSSPVNTFARNSKDKGYVVASRVSDNSCSNYQGILVKTDSLGNSGCNEASSGFTISSLSLNVTPLSLSSNSISLIFDVPACTSREVSLIHSAVCSYSLENGIAERQISGDCILFPNPATDVIYLKLDGSFGNGRLKLIDCCGNVVIDKAVHPGTNTIPLSPLSAGFYFYSLSNSDLQQSTGKIILLQH